MRARSLDLLAEPLTGMRLVEASAGTGKTHTLADLYLRLVLEGDYPVEAILVVTFTVAATAELRERIRARLESARAAIHLGSAPEDDAVMRGLLARLPDRARSARRLHLALADFDQAAVLTIHGFCQRVLTEHAFESGEPFETELIPDEGALIQEVVDDFWRKQIATGSAILVRYLLGQKWTPERLAHTIRPWLGKPYLTVVPLDPPADAEPEFRTCYQSARAAWRAEDTTIEGLVRDASLHATRYPRAALQAWCAALDEFFAPEEPTGDCPLQIQKFSTTALRNSARKNTVAPAHPFFECCERLVAAYEALSASLAARARALRLTLYRFVMRELAARKARRQILAYQDQLIRLDQALATRPDLAARLRSRFAAALIDEFQDTDPIQYRIFRVIYGDGQAPVFLVGDPKQAIFGFRGADVFTYLAAGRDVTERRTLDRNWRSAPDLVRAVNAVFGQARAPFLFPEIAFAPVTAAIRPRRALQIDGDAGPPFRIWRLPVVIGKQITKAEAAGFAVQATAGEIARLLNLADSGRARIDDAPLCGGDIAVLVRTNRQADAMREALSARGVASVQLGDASVYQSPEATDLERLLLGILTPEREDRLRAALGTVLLGMAANSLEALGEDEAAWEARLSAFMEYQALWREHGFLPMVRQVLRLEAVAARLLALPDGERRLTNLIHLCELLETAEVAERLTPSGVIRTLSEARREPPTDEAAQLRLASDENLVKIATIHKSKGLQYPIVFCPFLWDVTVRQSEDDFVLFHDPVSGEPTLDPGSSRIAEGQAQAGREALGENLRLAYVALTRAEHRCTMVWGNVNGGEKSGLAYLLHQPPTATDLVVAVRERAAGLSDEELTADIERLAAASGGAIGIEPAPSATAHRRVTLADAALHARPFGGTIPEGWRVSSFTGLVAGFREEADYDPWLHGDGGSVEATPDIFGFPRGIRAGLFLHAVFAAIDFAPSAQVEREALVLRLMREHDIASEWAPVLLRVVEDVLTTPLGAELAGVSLSAIPRDRRLIELPFFYPMAHWDTHRLANHLGPHAHAPALAKRLAALPRETVKGFMTGAIDLIFEHGGRYYLADYKSNWLGSDVEAYRRDRLADTMQHDGYVLQAAIYLLALHRYLAQRLPGYDPIRHLGGALYLFVRGMDPARGAGYGIYREAADAALILELDRLVGR